SAREAEDAAERLARAVGAGLLEAPLAADVSAFAGALVRLHALQNLGPELAQNRCPLPAGELAESPGDPALVLAAARRECERLRRRLLAAPRGLLDLPTRYRRAAVFALLAALRLLSLIEDGDADLLRRPPHLGLLSRLGLLARARWFRIG
ncbi:MAG TPA: hypothetical protein VOA87_00445, partial [Thermoanaerobaculia bacterium]|nr:hypothetical protein [Thermoanaerobaculia bacterium]